MSTIDKIIEEIQSKHFKYDSENPRVVNLVEVESIIRKHTEGMVLVPEDDMDLLFQLYSNMGDSGRWVGDEWVNNEKDTMAFDKKLMSIKAMLQASKEGE